MVCKACQNIDCIINVMTENIALSLNEKQHPMCNVRPHTSARTRAIDALHSG